VKTARPIARERADVFADSNVIEPTTRGKRTLPSSATRAWNEAYLGRFGEAAVMAVATALCSVGLRPPMSKFENRPWLDFPTVHLFLGRGGEAPC
jgi:hypothetical protein